MPGKPSLKNELIEELMEGKAILNNFARDVGDVVDSINKNEELDHLNDKIRNEVMGFLLSGLEAYNAKDYEGMQKYLHAAMQKLNQQGIVDEKDDQPRTDAKIKLLKAQWSAVQNEAGLTKLLEKIGGKKNAGSAAK